MTDSQTIDPSTETEVPEQTHMPEQQLAAAADVVATDAAATDIATTDAAATEPGESIPVKDVVEKDRFAEFALPEPLLNAIADLGFEYCTPIQSTVLPFSLSDYDVTGQAQTGTGKTAAFLVTILTRLWENPDQTPRPRGTPRALCLAPTRELALQIESDARDLSKYMGIGLHCVVGGMDFQKQLDKINAGPLDLLIATPGRLLDFINRRNINLKQVEVLVLDEADRMLDMGFIPDVRRIVYQTPHKRSRQTLFFSATFNEAVMRLARSWTLEPVHVSITPETVATDTVDQKFWLISSEDKAKVLLDFLRTAKPERALVFTNRRDQTHRLVAYLEKRGLNVEALAGDVPQRKRLSTLQRFKDGDVPYVIATDVAGRGIHVDGVSHVVNFDLPEEAEDYVHRIGRTGRAGAAGVSISFVSEDDAFNLPSIEEYLGTKISCNQPDFEPAPN